MKSKFKNNQLHIEHEPKNSSDVRVLKLDSGGPPSVQEFNFEAIQTENHGDYAATKRRFGPLAATDPDRSARKSGDARFQINPILRGPLTIEEEEKRVIGERVRARVEALAQEAKASAFSVGHEEGLKKGHDEAFAKFKEEGAVSLQKFEAFISQCESAKHEIFQANERFLLELIYRIARMILLRELSIDKQYVLRLARELIERVGVRENITLRLNEEDLSAAGQLKEGLEKSLGALTNLSIEASSQVSRGGCLIETEWNAIDASIETQLKGLYDSLLGRSGTESSPQQGGGTPNAVGN